MTRLRTLVAVAALVAGAGCSGGDRTGAASDQGTVGGTLVLATTADPAHLLPVLVKGTEEAQISDQIFDRLADIGPELNTIGDAGWTPRLARSWDWGADSLSLAFHIDPRARFHDGVPVRAEDVQFSVGLFQDTTLGSPAASALGDIDSVSVTDSLTATVWYHHRSPEAFYQIALNVRVMPAHLLRGADRAALENSDFAHHPVGSGPFQFVRWEPRSAIEVVADTSYFLGRPKLDRVIWSWSGEEAAAVTKLLAGDADFMESVSSDALSQVATTPSLHTVRYRLPNYGYLLFNFRDPANPARPHPLFSNPALRRALSLALDRQALVANVLDSLGRVGAGPYPSDGGTADPEAPQVPFDTVRADRMLDSLGWRDVDGDGYRERDGVPLRFSLLTPTSSAARVRYGVLLKEQWRRVGVRLDVEELDKTVANPRVFNGKFDAFIMSLTSDPSPAGIRETWLTRREGDGTYNFGSFSDPVVDALADSAMATFDPIQGRTLYRRAYQHIIDDTPAVWLYENEPHAAMNMRVHPVFDRGDSWWRDLRLWWLSPR